MPARNHAGMAVLLQRAQPRRAGVLAALLVLAGLAPPGLAAPAGGRTARSEAIPQDPLLQEDAYLIGPGDGLQLKILAATDLSGPVEVLNDGTASLPLLGSVRLSGLTLSQASRWLEALYRRQLLRPDLVLSVVRPRPLRIAVVGEVERPGLYTLSTSEASNTEAAVTISGLPTLVDGIQKAGGITATADLRQVTLQRRLPGATPRFKRTRLDLLALVQQGDQLQNPLLFDGDTIRVEKAREEVADTAELAATMLAPKQITVNVVGEVKAPGRIQVPANTPLMQAVLAAGGVNTWRAKTSKLELVRINRNGTATRRSYGLNYSQGVSLEQNPPLRDGDTVIVNRSRYAVSADAVAAVATPLSGLANVLTLIQILNNTNR